ncbi:hypothetical protein QQS21_009168 [Conoideocrella luteorostrata]|uniref:Uncharacterized protein n=1 Tax=Conoideocrella luteorostrata TaxID=1105319 RepID=A0AAJ0CK42_9HYPO|nr:hypothetical protein QQS21_009168 [Conoideocrella luteorostrata]
MERSAWYSDSPVSELTKLETNLPYHGIEFQFSSNGCRYTFRILLILSSQLRHDGISQSIKRLAAQDDTKKAIALLLQGQDSMSEFMNLQIRMLQYDSISIIPLRNAVEIVAAVESLRNHCKEDISRAIHFDKHVIQKDIVRNCVRGFPLSETQTTNLMSTVTGLSDLARTAGTPEGESRIVDALGATDGFRVISYFKDGPRPL